MSLNYMNSHAYTYVQLHVATVTNASPVYLTKPADTDAAPCVWDARFSLDIKIPCLARAGTLYGLRYVGVWYGTVSRERRPHPDSAQYNLAEGQLSKDTKWKRGAGVRRIRKNNANKMGW